MKIIGHRGARGLAPENTIGGLLKAIELGVDEIEFDVRVTRDKIPVLSHDPALHSPSGDAVEIAKHTLNELRAFKPDTATLADVFKILDGKTPLQIEVKPHEPVMPIAKVISAHVGKKWPAANVLIASKHQRTLLALHRLLPELPTVVIESWSGIRAHHRAKQLGTVRVSMRSTWLWSGFLRAAKRSGIQLTPYTMNDPRQVQKWQRYLYGVITDYPDRFTD